MYTAYNFFIFTSYNCLALGTSASLFTIIYMTAGTFLSFGFGLEKVGCVKLLAIIICSIGALLVSQPKFLHLNQSEGEDLNSNRPDIETCENGTMPEADTSNIEQFGNCYTKGVIFAMLAGLAYALFNFIQKMKLQDLSTNVLVFYACSIGGIVSWITAFATEDITLPHSETKIILFIGHCVLSILPCTAVYAQRLTSVAILSASQSSFLVFMFLGQYTLMKNIFPGERNSLEVLGACVITIGSALVPITILGEVFLSKVKDRFSATGSYQNIPQNKN